jgi:hypothetical protein
MCHSSRIPCSGSGDPRLWRRGARSPNPDATSVPEEARRRRDSTSIGSPILSGPSGRSRPARLIRADHGHCARAVPVVHRSPIGHARIASAQVGAVARMAGHLVNVGWFTQAYSPAGIGAIALS